MTPRNVLPSAVSGIVLQSGTSGANYDFGEVPAISSISGRVWLDSNDNGTIDGNETGIPGIAIELSGTDHNAQPVTRSTVTDAHGGYRFDNLLPGTYTVREPAQPAGTLNGRTVAGSAGGSATPVATVPSQVSGITLLARQESTDNNFGEVKAASLSGRVWNDLDNDGVVDTGEPGLAGVTVQLTGTDRAGNPVTRSTVTDAEGRYRFADLPPGTYTVTEPTQPTGTANGRTVAGSAGGTSTPLATTPSAISTIVLGSGVDAIDNNFGEIRTSSLAGRVWNDVDSNGQIGAAETGIAGVTINLSGTDDTGQAVTRSTVTDAEGRYRFADLRPGTYTVTEPDQPPRTHNGQTVPGSTAGTATPVSTVPSAISTITLPAGRESVENNFGELPLASLSGRVWIDHSNDGRIDSGEPGIPNVSIVLTGTDDQGRPVQRTTTTGPDGSYTFTDLRPGTYTVTEPNQPPNTSNGPTVPGSTGGSATPVTSAPSVISGIVLTPGTDSVDNRFGELQPVPDLVVAKAAVEPRFTVNRAAHYSISVRNAGNAPSAGAYTVADRLPTGLTLAATPTGSGWTCSGAAGAATFSCSSSAVIAAGAANPSTISVTVRVAEAAAQASPAINAVLVEGGGEPASRQPTQPERDAYTGNPGTLPACPATPTHNACHTSTVVQLPAALSGTVWLEQGPARGLLDAGDRRLPGWRVEVINTATGAIEATTTTGDDGRYRVIDLEPGVTYAVRFRDPASGTVHGYPVNGETAPGSSGASCNPQQQPSSCVGTGDPQLTVVLAPGQELPQQSLPVDPSGVVYDALTRDPVAGAVVTLAPSGSCPGWNPATHVAGATLGGFTLQGNGIAMTTGPDGHYQFLFVPGAPARCDFTFTVTPPPTHTFVSQVIPPAPNTLILDGSPGSVVAVQPQPGAPTAPVGPGTVYHLVVNVGSGTPGVVHNHIPLDPATPTGLLLRKTGDRAIAELGDSVRYSISVRLTAGAAPRQVSVIDSLPPGFTYIAGTAVVDGRPIADPANAPGPRLAFQLGAMPASGELTLQYRVRIGVGALQGDGINRAIAYGCGVAASCLQPGTLTPLPVAKPTNEGQHRVRVTGGVFTTDACMAGKVFVDCNGNHVQDPEELGIPGVRLVMQDGTTLISDSEGKYAACGLLPKSHVLRIDPTTLPKDARLTTSSNRNLGDAGSLWLDLKNGELHRADFIEGSCSAPVLEQVKKRRQEGEVRAPDSANPPALKFDSRPRPPGAGPAANGPSGATSTTGTKQEGSHGTR